MFHYFPAFTKTDFRKTSIRSENFYYIAEIQAKNARSVGFLGDKTSSIPEVLFLPNTKLRVISGDHKKRIIQFKEL